MNPFENRTVVLGVGGGIAAYRVCELARLLMKRGASVRVAMTQNAQRFVTPVTFQALTGNPVLTDLFDLHQKAIFGHLEMGKRADLLIVAPATANLIARIRTGMGDDAVTTSILSSSCPVLIAPAMNVQMWRNAQVQENVAALRADLRCAFVGPGVGTLAEGIVGEGRLSEPHEILDAAEALLTPQDLGAKKFVITAGPTREFSDPVRFLSNPSTGRMGFALARAAAVRGAQVTLISGPVELDSPPRVLRIDVTSAEQMRDATLRAIDGADVFISSAAVCDQRPARRVASKVKKEALETTMALARTPDVLREARARFGDAAFPDRPLFVGFAAETDHVLDNARHKLADKRLDLVAANDVAEPGSGFASASNRLTLLFADGRVTPFDSLTKIEAAHRLLDAIVPVLSP
ncbi:MAG: bifunctional phosphopantothenoylcysteine decarboxylase/phosphopantothenate--cysteine ligase CoaBC [Myxococcales bacterium]|nr:bifunctional phosphopantothenoylcysteine decarboxylase/phosphopantothenate--cysteine ligase CoaBC [Myxococcales bacterium]